jgi:dTDP-4-dehydrorhamnose 3,5-epimerase-like enzyme
MTEPQLIKGGLAIDDRGSVRFVNDFSFENVKRFYVVENHQAGFVRAWHGHKKEGKYFIAIQGDILLCGVQIDSWEQPSKSLKIHRYILSDKLPSILYLPRGFANGMMSLSENARLLVFSTCTLQESLNDDIRFDSRYWDPWHIEER